MKKSETNDRVRINHIFEEMRRIESFVESLNFDEFQSDDKTQYASIRSLEIIGEASNYLTSDLILAHPEIAWSDLIGLRNLLIHNYFGVDTKLVWEIITVDFPVLRLQIQKILDEFPTKP